MNVKLPTPTKGKRWTTNDFGVTYAQCDMPPELALQQLHFRFDDKVRYIGFVQEFHKDGNAHLHGQLQFEKDFGAVSTSFDLLWKEKVFHCKIDKVKNSTDWHNYITKTGGKLHETGQFAELKARIPGGLKKRNTNKLTNKELLEGDLEKLIEEERLSLHSLAGVLNGRRLFAELKRKQKKPLPEALPANWKDSTGVAVNLFLLDKKEKQRHYWLYSSMPNKGKTTFLERLRAEFACSDYSAQEKFQNVHRDSDFLLFDEFGKGNSVTYTVMNQICDGTYKYPIKGREAVVLDKPYVILGSNFPINTVYPSSNGRIEARFNEVCLDNLEFI